MIPRILLFAACCCLIGSQVAAQDATRKRLFNFEAKEIDARKMYEDIEIMRRLLRGKLDNLQSARKRAMGGMQMMDGQADALFSLGYLAANGMAQFGSRARSTQSAAVNIDGVYLPGHGVVFTVNLPAGATLAPNPHSSLNLDVSSCANCHESDPQVKQRFAESLAKQPKPLTEWEKTRRDVLGIKAADRKKAPAVSLIEICDPGTIAELVLHVLSENGRHVSQLPSDEQVTVAITFRKPAEKQKSHFSDVGNGIFKVLVDDGGSLGSGSGITFKDVRLGVGVDQAGPAQSPGPNPIDNAVQGFESVDDRGKAKGGNGKSTYRDYLLLGDLHMKQNKPDQAFKAYERALSTLADPAKLTHAELQDATTATRRAILDLHQKLTQAALADKKAEVAKKWVERLIGLQKAPSSRATPKDATKPLSLPARLIVSAQKLLLDQVGAEKITFDDFRKKASVQHLSLTKK